MLMMQAAPTPWKARAAISSGRVPPSAQASDPSVNSTDAGNVDLLVADPVAEGGKRQQEDGDRQLIGVDDPHRHRRRRAELARDRRKRDIGDGAVEHGHRQGEPDRRRRPIAAGHGQAVAFLLALRWTDFAIHVPRPMAGPPNEPQDEAMRLLGGATPGRRTTATRLTPNGIGTVPMQPRFKAEDRLKRLVDPVARKPVVGGVLARELADDPRRRDQRVEQGVEVAEQLHLEPSLRKQLASCFFV